MIQAGDLKNEHLKGQFGKLALHGERKKKFNMKTFSLCKKSFQKIAKSSL